MDQHQANKMIRVFSVAAVILLPGLVAGQDVSLTSSGVPDLQGVWDFRTITPLERPEDLGEKAFLTAEEVADLEEEAIARNERLLNEAARRTEAGGNIGAYNNFWMDRGTNAIEGRRTSLIVDPPNGRLPVVTEGGQARRSAGRGSFSDGVAESYVDLSNFDRCILGFNAGPPMTPGAYNNNMQLFQTSNYIVVLTEMVHTARIIPIGERVEMTHGIRQWSGESRGYWEGNTLVVETENFNDHESHITWRGSSKNMRLEERFTRVDSGTLLYTFTVSDPETWAETWTAEVPMRRNDLPLFEYACHEGNYSMEAMLSGARADERKVASENEQ